MVISFQSKVSSFHKIVSSFHEKVRSFHEKVTGNAKKTCLINVKKILAVINATYAVAKRKPEKIRPAGTRTLTSAIPVQRSYQLS